MKLAHKTLVNSEIYSPFINDLRQTDVQNHHFDIGRAVPIHQSTRRVSKSKITRGLQVYNTVF